MIIFLVEIIRIRIFSFQVEKNLIATKRAFADADLFQILKNKAAEYFSLVSFLCQKATLFGFYSRLCYPQTYMILQVAAVSSYKCLISHDKITNSVSYHGIFVV